MWPWPPCFNADFTVRGQFYWKAQNALFCKLRLPCQSQANGFSLVERYTVHIMKRLSVSFFHIDGTDSDNNLQIPTSYNPILMIPCNNFRLYGWTYALCLCSKHNFLLCYGEDGCAGAKIMDRNLFVYCNSRVRKSKSCVEIQNFDALMLFQLCLSFHLKNFMFGGRTMWVSIVQSFMAKTGTSNQCVLGLVGEANQYEMFWALS